MVDSTIHSVTSSSWFLLALCLSVRNFQLQLPKWPPVPNTRCREYTFSTAKFALVFDFWGRLFELLGYVDSNLGARQPVRLGCWLSPIS